MDEFWQRENFRRYFTRERVVVEVAEKSTTQMVHAFVSVCIFDAGLLWNKRRIPEPFVVGGTQKLNMENLFRKLFVGNRKMLTNAAPTQDCPSQLTTRRLRKPVSPQKIDFEICPTRPAYLSFQEYREVDRLGCFRWLLCKCENRHQWKVHMQRGHLKGKLRKHNFPKPDIPNESPVIKDFSLALTGSWGLRGSQFLREAVHSTHKIAHSWKNQT